MTEIIKKHWLYGDCKFNVDVKKEDDCTTCIHLKVCSRETEEFCKNFLFGTSAFRNCDACTHHCARWNERQPIPCFKCKHYKENR
jgi:hypothetical protein